MATSMRHRKASRAAAVRGRRCMAVRSTTAALSSLKGEGDF